jgi:gluconate 2-dehydrogenase gamma chain
VNRTGRDPTTPPPEGAGLDRREVLVRATAVAGTATMGWFWFEGFGDPLRRTRVAPTPAGAPGRTFDPAEWRTMAAALDRILPSGPGSPGAREVNAVGYLDAVLLEPEFDETWPRGIRGGAARLLARARAQGASAFDRLAPDRQDEAIASFETTAEGLRWLRRVVYLTLEALLGDPVHGGNRDEAGWRWIGFRPPSPRPTEPGWRPPRR